MLSLKVDRFMVWPVRIIFVVLAILVGDNIWGKVAQGYVISTGSTKYVAGSLIYYTTLMKFFALEFLLIFLAFRTIDKEPKKHE